MDKLITIQWLNFIPKSTKNAVNAPNIAPFQLIVMSTLLCVLILLAYNYLSAKIWEFPHEWSSIFLAMYQDYMIHDILSFERINYELLRLMFINSTKSNHNIHNDRTWTDSERVSTAKFSDFGFTSIVNKSPAFSPFEQKQ